jgi:hypothetical protein
MLNIKAKEKSHSMLRTTHAALSPSLIPIGPVVSCENNKLFKGYND